MTDPVLPNSVQTVNRRTTQRTATDVHTTKISTTNSLFGLLLVLTASMNILQINIHALSTSKSYLENYVDKCHIDIASISETWHQDDDWKFKDWKCNGMFKNRINNTYGGVATLPRPSIKLVRRKDLERPDIEVTWAQAEVTGTMFFIATVYIPPNCTSHFHKLELNLTDVANRTQAPILLLGDFNARSYLWENWHTSQPTRYDKAWKHGRIIESMMIRHGLQIHNTGGPTRMFNGQKSAIDLTLSLRAPPDFITWKVDHQNSLWTDHLPILVHLKGKDSTAPSVRARWNLKAVDWDCWKHDLGDKLKIWQENIEDANTKNPDEVCESFTNIIQELADKHIPQKSVCKHRKPFMNNELRELLKACKAASKR